MNPLDPNSRLMFSPTIPRVLRRLLPLALLLATASPLAAGGEVTLRLHPEETRITFTLGATLHTVRGSLRLQEGEIRFDPVLGMARGRIVVNAQSAETGNRRRDRDMHVKVLESEEYPEIVFSPVRLEGEFNLTGESQVELHGRLWIHGEDHPLALPAKVEVEGDTLRARSTFTIPYVEWGMKDPSTFFLRVAKTVEVQLEAVGTLER